jgi:hypothetical protein
MSVLQLVIANAFVSGCIVYYMTRKTALRRRMLREEARERGARMTQMMLQLRKK